MRMRTFRSRSGPRLSGARGRRRRISGLGVALIVIGLVVLLVTYSRLPSWVYGLWPLILVGLGIFGLISRPGWVSELDYAVPGAWESFDRPRRTVSLALIVTGLIILPFSLHLVDDRTIGPVILILLGVLLLWRRTR
jgi:hypothetical protein